MMITLKKLNIAVQNARFWMVALGFALFGILLHYPGHVPYDGITQWYEARTGILFSQHPPALSLIWRFLDQLASGPGLLTSLQITILWLSVGLLFNLLRLTLVQSIAFGVFLLFYPLSIAMQGLIVKDIISSHFALLSAMVGIQAKYCRNDLRLWVVAFALAALATMIRYQFAIILPSLLLIGAQCRNLPWSRKALIWGTGMIAFAGTMLLVQALIKLNFVPSEDPRYQTALDRNIGHDPVDRSVRKILIYDIAGVIVNDQAAPLSVLEAAGIDVERLKRMIIDLYSTSHVDTLWVDNGVFRMLSNISNHQVFHQWMISVTSSPLAFTRHRFGCFARVIGIGDIYACFPVHYGIYTGHPLAAQMAVSSYFHPLSSKILANKYFPVTPFFKSFVYLICGLAVVIYCVRRYGMSYPALALSISGLIYEISFFVLPQACDVRYSYFMFLTTVFSTMMILAPGSAQDTPRRRNFMVAKSAIDAKITRLSGDEENST